MQTINTVYQAISTPLLARLDYIRLQPKRILVFSQYSVFAVLALQKRYPSALIITAQAMSELVYQENTFDFVFAELPLTDHDPNIIFHFFYRALKHEGLLLFSSLGPDSFLEFTTHAKALIDMHHIGDGLLTAQFADPVMDRDMITVACDDLSDLHHLFLENKVEYAGEKTNNQYSVTLESLSGLGWKMREDTKAKIQEHAISVASVKKNNG